MMNNRQFYLENYNNDNLQLFKNEFYKFIPIYENRDSNLITGLLDDPFELTDNMKPFLQDAGVIDHMFFISWVQVKSNGSLSIHKDPIEWVWSLVIPLENYNNTYAESYNASDEPILISTGDCSYWKYVSGTFDLVESMELNRPIFMWNQGPHTIKNTTSNFSYYISFRLSKDYVV